MRAEESSRIKIGTLIGSFRTGGAELQLIHLLERLDRARFVPIAFTLGQVGPLSRRLVDHGIEVIPLNITRRRALSSLHGAITRVRAMELDLLYCVLADSVIFGSILGKLAGVRYIVGGFRGLGMTWSRGQIWGVRITRFLCNSYIVNSDAVKEARITREHLSADNIKVIPNGLDLSLYPFTPKKEALVGMVASLKKIKGQDQFIEAARILIDRGLELKFMLVGDGPDRQRLEEKVQRLNLQDAFVFKGNVSNVANYITRFKILVSASEFEGLSNSILEALSAGTPVIASDVPSNNEIISNMEDGLLYEYGNAEDLAGKIVLMIENSAMYGSMQIKARQKAERDFEMSKMITRMEDYFQSLMLRGRI